MSVAGPTGIPMEACRLDLWSPESKVHEGTAQEVTLETVKPKELAKSQIEVENGGIKIGDQVYDIHDATGKPITDKKLLQQIARHLYQTLNKSKSHMRSEFEYAPDGQESLRQAIETGNVDRIDFTSEGVDIQRSGMVYSAHCQGSPAEALKSTAYYKSFAAIQKKLIEPKKKELKQAEARYQKHAERLQSHLESWLNSPGIKTRLGKSKYCTRSENKARQSLREELLRLAKNLTSDNPTIARTALNSILSLMYNNMTTDENLNKLFTHMYNDILPQASMPQPGGKPTFASLQDSVQQLRQTLQTFESTTALTPGGHRAIKGQSTPLYHVTSRKKASSTKSPEVKPLEVCQRELTEAHSTAEALQKFLDTALSHDDDKVVMVGQHKLKLTPDLKQRLKAMKDRADILVDESNRRLADDDDLETLSSSLSSAISQMHDDMALLLSEIRKTKNPDIFGDSAHKSRKSQFCESLRHLTEELSAFMRFDDAVQLRREVGSHRPDVDRSHPYSVAMEGFLQSADRMMYIIQEVSKRKNKPDTIRHLDHLHETLTEIIGIARDRVQIDTGISGSPERMAALNKHLRAEYQIIQNSMRKLLAKIPPKSPLQRQLVQFHHRVRNHFIQLQKATQWSTDNVQRTRAQARAKADNTALQQPCMRLLSSTLDTAAQIETQFVRTLADESPEHIIISGKKFPVTQNIKILMTQIAGNLEHLRESRDQLNRSYSPAAIFANGHVLQSAVQHCDDTLTTVVEGMAQLERLLTSLKDSPQRAHMLDELSKMKQYLDEHNQSLQSEANKRLSALRSSAAQHPPSVRMTSPPGHSSKSVPKRPRSPRSVEHPLAPPPKRQERAGVPEEIAIRAGELFADTERPSVESYRLTNPNGTEIIEAGIEKLNNMALGEWLDESIMDAYMNMLQKKCDADEDSNTLFLTSMSGTLLRMGELNTGDLNASSFENARVVIPINAGTPPNHWAFVVVDNTGGSPEVTYYDSLQGQTSEGTYKSYAGCWEDEIRPRIQAMLTSAGLEDITYHLATHEEMPRQNNSDDCGVYACQMMRYLSLGDISPLTISPESRSTMLLELAGDKLIETEGIEGDDFLETEIIEDDEEEEYHPRLSSQEQSILSAVHNASDVANALICEDGQLIIRGREWDLDDAPATLAEELMSAIEDIDFLDNFETVLPDMETLESEAENITTVITLAESLIEALNSPQKEEISEVLQPMIDNLTELQTLAEAPSIRMPSPPPQPTFSEIITNAHKTFWELSADIEGGDPEIIQQIKDCERILLYARFETLRAEPSITADQVQLFTKIIQKLQEVTGPPLLVQAREVLQQIIDAIPSPSVEEASLESILPPLDPSIDASPPQNPLNLAENALNALEEDIEAHGDFYAEGLESRVRNCHLAILAARLAIFDEEAPDLTVIRETLTFIDRENPDTTEALSNFRTTLNTILETYALTEPTPPPARKPPQTRAPDTTKPTPPPARKPATRPIAPQWSSTSDHSRISGQISAQTASIGENSKIAPSLIRAFPQAQRIIQSSLTRMMRCLPMMGRCNVQLTRRNFRSANALFTNMQKTHLIHLQRDYVKLRHRLSGESSEELTAYLNQLQSLIKFLRTPPQAIPQS